MSHRKRTLAKLNVAGDEYFLLTTTVGDDGDEGFELVLSDGVKGYKGSLDENDLETLSHEVKMDYSDYTSQTRKALTRVNLGSLNFVYQMKKQKDGSLLLSWKKHMMAENIKFQLGSVKLNPATDSSEVTVTLFKEAIAAAEDLQTTITSLQAENERMATERTNALKRLEKCVAAKEELESELYSKFAVVINDKKAKIRELKSELDDGRSGAPSVAPDTKAGPSTSNSHSKVRRDDTDEDIGVASDYDTDEETSPAAKKAKPTKRVKEEPLSQDDSLILDTGDAEVLPSSRRRRQREATKKSTPSRAVLPKVSSTPKTTAPRTGRAGRRTSMKKSASNSSNVSSDQLDPDAMIDDMF